MPFLERVALFSFEVRHNGARRELANSQPMQLKAVAIYYVEFGSRASNNQNIHADLHSFRLDKRFSSNQQWLAVLFGQFDC